MAKVETTAKSIRWQYGLLICVGYCALQDLLTYEQPQAYTHGVYGWNADVYDMSIIGRGNIAIVTGYRPFGQIHPSYEVTEKYEKLAMEIKQERHDDIRARLRELIKQFVEEVLDV